MRCARGSGPRGTIVPRPRPSRRDLETRHPSETRPKELTLAIGGDTPNVTLKLDEPLPGKMDPGGEISFFGAAKEFSKDPYMLTFEVAPDDLEGWTGKGPAPARPAGAGKKGAPAPATKK